MKIAYRGNFQPDLPPEVRPWSTESHVAASLELLGHEVVRVQESEIDWQTTYELCKDAQLFLWTSTYGMALGWDRDEARTTVEKLNELLPTAGFHLDLWHGLNRAAQLDEEPFWQLQHLFTADGDHDDGFAQRGINHHWLPPAVYSEECVPGSPRREYTSDVAFVGSWRHYGHEEWWPHRRAMLNRLRRQYGRRVAFWPQHGAVRGQDLNDLYASVKVTVGDSCLANRSRRYFSDRAFETVGRGGFLVMSRIPALTEMLIEGEHCAYYAPGDLREMINTVNYYLAHEDERERIRAAGQAHVRENHTYLNRMRELLDVVGIV